MGSGDWFKALICLKRRKCKQLEFGGTKSKLGHKKGQPTQTVAAIRIQSAFRAYVARKALRRLKGMVRFRGVIQEGYDVKNQALSALNHIHFWSRIQDEIKARRFGMVIESRTSQKKLENQLKLEAKLHEIEVEWCGGPETMEEILNRIQQREEAAAKRERAMAYAFSHQWRANSSQYFGQSYYDLGKESWGWSWRERWIAVRPWENRVQSRPIANANAIMPNKLVNDIEKTASKKSLKSVLSNVKVSTQAA